MPRGILWTLLFVVITLVFVPGTAVAQEETAWDAFVREDPSVAEEGATPRLERQILQRLTPKQAERFAAGEDPATILLADGLDLGTALTEALSGPGGVYVPVDSCKLTGAGVPGGDLYPDGDTEITVRGTCGISTEAVGLVVNIKVPSPTEGGRVSLFPAGGGVFGPGFVNFTIGTSFNNAVVVELCEGTCASGDLTVRMTNLSAPQKVVFHTMGYFEPDGDADSTNEFNTSVGLVGTELQVTDAGATLGADLDASMATDAELGVHTGNAMNPHAVTLEQLTPTTAKGDLLVEDGADVVALPAGTDGQVLMADSGVSEGVKWSAPAMTGNPDPPCFDNSTRFVDCGNGTVTDTVTGIIWLVNANCFGTENYAAANNAAAALADGQCGLTDGSRAGDWRLQTKEEWEAMVDSSCPTAPKIVGNGSSGGCYTDNPWSSGVQTSIYWSSTTDSVASGRAWAAFMFAGDVGDDDKDFANRVWPVRGGQ